MQASWTNFTIPVFSVARYSATTCTLAYIWGNKIQQWENTKTHTHTHSCEWGARAEMKGSRLLQPHTTPNSWLSLYTQKHTSNVPHWQLNNIAAAYWDGHAALSLSVCVCLVCVHKPHRLLHNQIQISSTHPWQSVNWSRCWSTDMAYTRSPKWWGKCYRGQSVLIPQMFMRLKMQVKFIPSLNWTATCQ